MCLISVCPKGTAKYTDQVKTFIQNGFNSNKDGSGFMYKKNGENFIYVEKGFFKFSDLMNAIEKAKLTDDDELVIHHRIGTSGKVSEENTHPFVISHVHDIVKSVSTKINKPCIVHNGYFSDIYEYMQRNPDFSDTYAFARYVMPNVIDLYTSEPKLFRKALSGIVGTSKICVLLPYRDLIMSGNFTEDDGYFHSNNGYKNWGHRDVGGVTERSFTPAIGTNTGTQSAVAVASTKLAIGKVKEPVVLNAHMIDINKFNFHHFFYQADNSSDVEVYSILVYTNDDDVTLENNTEKVRISKKITKKSLYSYYKFYPKPQYAPFYQEYSYLLARLSPSKNSFKKIYHILMGNRVSEFSNTIRVNKLQITVFTAINYYLSCADQYLNDNSQFSNVKPEEFMKVLSRNKAAKRLKEMKNSNNIAEAIEIPEETVSCGIATKAVKDEPEESIHACPC